MALTHTALIGCVALFLGACASSVSVAPQVTRAKSTLAAAETVQAEQHPRAALHLKMAKDQIAAAEQRMADGHLVDDDDRTSVVWLLERAEADAELALLLARTGQAKQEARLASDRIRTLQLEME